MRMLRCHVGPGILCLTTFLTTLRHLQICCFTLLVLQFVTFGIHQPLSLLLLYITYSSLKRLVACLSFVASVLFYSVGASVVPCHIQEAHLCTLPTVLVDYLW